MSKRDSVAAHLPSLALMAEEMQVDSRHGPSGATASTTPPAYAAETPTLPGPSSSTGYGYQPQADPRDFLSSWEINHLFSLPNDALRRSIPSSSSAFAMEMPQRS